MQAGRYRNSWYWFVFGSFALILSGTTTASVCALPYDNATAVMQQNSRFDMGPYGLAMSSHQTKDASRGPDQSNTGGPSPSSPQQAQVHQQTTPSHRTSQMSGEEKDNPQDKYFYSGMEGTTAGIKPNMIDTPMTQQEVKYSDPTGDTGDNSLLNGPSNSMGGGGGSLDLNLLNNDSLFPKGSCCVSTQGTFNLQNPPPCCKVNGTFDPFGIKPLCCQQQNNNNNKKNNGGGGGGNNSGPMFQSLGALHTKTSGAIGGLIAAATAMTGSALNSAASGKTNPAMSDGQAKQSSRSSSAGEDALRQLYFMIDDYTQYLINVANENAGAACSADQPTKTYANVVYMVQRMYHSTYLPLALLFLLPGAVITQTKTLVSFGFLSARDDDTVSPFAGIFRAVIGIFLIPVTQLALSYMVDVGNACEQSVNKYVSMPLIYLWIEEQIVIYDPQQQGKMIKNLPNIPMAPWKGKFAGMPIKGAMMEQVSGLDAALAEICNEAVHMLSVAMSVMSAFQIALMCYLLLVGPLCASFFAWPGVGRELFRRAFASWLDAVVIVSLWKFWWCVVLACWTIWLEQGGINPFDPMGPYWLIAWMAILISVPFNPFEFKPSEIITHVMAKAEAVAAKVAQSGKGGGSGGGGKASRGGGGGAVGGHGGGMGHG